MGVLRIARAFLNALLAPSPVTPTRVEPPSPRSPTEAEIALLLQEIRDSLAQVDALADVLAEDATPLYVAARSLADESLAELEKAEVDYGRLARNAQQVKVLADAIRERVLLAGMSRRASLPN